MNEAALEINEDILTSSKVGVSNQYLTFVIGEESYALEILCIKEILEYGAVTKIPLAPNYLRGVINLRGSVLPIVDLAVRLGKQRGEVSRKTCIVVIEIEYENEPMDIGIVVDGVSEVVDINGASIEAAPSFGANIRQDFISGMCNIKDKFVILLNANKVLSVEELSSLGQP